VDLRDADIAMVLSRIGEQAGFAVVTGPIAGRTVSIQFTDTELVQGLRRLLRLASLSYSLVYAARTESGVGIKELRVFSEGEGDTRSLSRVATRTVEAPTNDTQQLQKESPTSPNPLLEFLQRQQQAQPEGQQVPAPAPAPPNPLLEFLQRQQQAQPEGQQVPAPAPAPPNPFLEFLQGQQQAQSEGQQVPAPAPAPPNPFLEFLQGQQQ
jgi:hypothetical protein